LRKVWSGGASVTFFLKTQVFDKPRPVTDAARKIKALPFSQIVLDMLFSINYHYNES
jgi:hypothetical protein